MHKRMLLLALLALMILPITAQDTPALDVTEYQLDNGLEVILVADHSAPTVAVNVTYQVGGANDPQGRSGFAHLFEHLMFEETAHLSTGELDQLVETAGGYLNAYTDTERTVYYTALPAHQLPLALWFEADRLASLVVSEGNVENQRDVVIQEYNLRVANSAYGEVFEDLFTLPYSYASYRKRVIGSVEDLNAATIDDVRAFHATYYVPNNATLVVAGDIDVEQTRALIDDYFAAIPTGDEPPALPAPTKAASQGERRTVSDPLANVPALLIGYPIPARSDADFAALEVTSRLLGSGVSSRMAQALIDTGLALDTGAFTSGNVEEGLFTAYAFANMGVDLAQLEEIYLAELARIVSEGVTVEELEKTINQIRSERIVGLETVEGLAESVQEANFYFDDPQATLTEIERFAQVTSEDVQRVVAEYLTPERATVLLVQPGEAAADMTEEPADVTEAPEMTEEPAEAANAEATEIPMFVIEQDTPPEPLEVRDFVLPEITETKLSNGLTLIIIPRPEVPIISVDVYMPGGESAAPAALAGLGELTAGVLTRGTTTRSAQEIAAEIEQVGGIIGADATADRLSVGAFALREDADLVFGLLSDVVQNPTFPDTEVDVTRERLQTNLQDIFSDPAALAARTFTSLVYGEHPYGHLMTDATLEAMTPDAVKTYYGAQANPERSFMIVTGDITADDAVALAEKAFGSWEAAVESDVTALPAVEASIKPGIYLVDRPGSTQAEYAIGLLTMTGSDPNRYASQVLNAIFGGTFSARLSGVIREELGYTYGIYSTFTRPVAEGTFSISTAVGGDVAAPALEEILNQINLIRDEAVPEEELGRVVTGIIGSEALRLETYQSLVNQIASYRLRGIPISELEELTGRYEAIDQAVVQNAAQTYIVPENLLIVVVGDASVLEAPLSEIGPVTIIEAE